MLDDPREGGGWSALAFAPLHEALGSLSPCYPSLSPLGCPSGQAIPKADSARPRQHHGEVTLLAALSRATINDLLALSVGHYSSRSEFFRTATLSAATTASKLPVVGWSCQSLKKTRRLVGSKPGLTVGGFTKILKNFVAFFVAV